MGLIDFLLLECYMWQRNDSPGRRSPVCLWVCAQLRVSKWPLIEFTLAGRFVPCSEERNKGCKSTPSFTQEESKRGKCKYLYIIAGQTGSEALLPPATSSHMVAKPESFQEGQ